MTPLTQILTGIATFVVVFVLGCATGYSNRDSAAKTAAAKAYKAAQDQLEKKQGEIDVLSAKYEEERERANKVLHERTNTIREYYNNTPAVAPSCALPDPMYGLLANSVRDANAYATSELGADMPDPTPAAEPRD
jgi:molybdopterin-guanine dinucleotide biosynthesis protein A